MPTVVIYAVSDTGGGDPTTTTTSTTTTGTVTVAGVASHPHCKHIIVCSCSIIFGPLRQAFLCNAFILCVQSCSYVNVNDKHDDDEHRNDEYVDDEYDHGPILVQRRVPVLEGDDVDSLAARVFEAECEAYPEAIQMYIDGRVHIEDGEVTIQPAADADTDHNTKD